LISFIVGFLPAAGTGSSLGVASLAIGEVEKARNVDDDLDVDARDEARRDVVDRNMVMCMWCMSGVYWRMYMGE
jgi:hypothetical protein